MRDRGKAWMAIVVLSGMAAVPVSAQVEVSSLTKCPRAAELRLRADLAVQLTYTDEEVDATSADLRIAQFLQHPRGTPLMRIRQVIYFSNGKPVI